MAKLPKFKVKGLGWNMREEIRDLEQATASVGREVAAIQRTAKDRGEDPTQGIQLIPTRPCTAANNLSES